MPTDPDWRKLPRKKPGEHLSTRFEIRLRPCELEFLRRMAKAEETKASTLLREIIEGWSWSTEQAALKAARKQKAAERRAAAAGEAAPTTLSGTS